MADASRSAVGLPLLFVLALLASVAPFGSDLYLAAFPDMRADLAGSETAIQLTLTMFLLGMAAGQLVFGPLSDRVGRRRPLLVGTALFVLASIGAAVAPTLGVLLAARLLQGLSAAAGMVLGRAVIADLSTGQAAARAFTLLMLIAGVAPVVAPLLGSALVDHIGWRGVLVVLAGLAVAMFAGSAALVPETLPRAQRNRAGGIAWGELARGRYLWATAAYTFSFCVMMAYISASPFLYQELIGMSALAYGALFALNAFGLMLTNALGARLLRKYHAQTVLGVGIAWLFLASVAILVLALSPAGVAWLPVPIFFVVSSLGFTRGPATALALDAVPDAVGTGSAVLGTAQFTFAALATPLVSLGQGATAMAVVMGVFAAIAGISFLALARARRDPDATPIPRGGDR